MTLTQPRTLFEPGGHYDSRETMSKTAGVVVKAAEKLAEYKEEAEKAEVPTEGTVLLPGQRHQTPP